MTDALDPRLRTLIAQWRENYGWDNSARSAYTQAADELEELLDATLVITPAERDPR